MKKVLGLTIFCWLCAPVIQTHASNLPANLQFTPATVSPDDRAKLYAQLPLHIRDFVERTPTIFAELESQKIFDQAGDVAGPNCHAIALGWKQPRVLDLQRLIQFSVRYHVNGRRSVDTRDGRADFLSEDVRFYTAEHYMDRHLKVLWTSGNLEWQAAPADRLQRILTGALALPEVKRGDILQLVAVQEGVDAPLDEFNQPLITQFKKEDVFHSAVILDKNWLFEKENYNDAQYRIEALVPELINGWIHIYKPAKTFVALSRISYTMHKLKLQIVRYTP